MTKADDANCINSAERTGSSLNLNQYRAEAAFPVSLSFLLKSYLRQLWQSCPVDRLFIVVLTAYLNDRNAGNC